MVDNDLKTASTQSIRIGISQCLLGESVRYDGGHKRDGFLVDVLGRYVEWVPVCPEAEAGLGIPREAMRLQGHPEAPRLVTIRTQRDHTDTILRFAEQRVVDLESFGLSGYVFKKDSPSCGITRVRLFNEHGMPSRKGIGLFAKEVRQRLPLLPVEEEGRLCDPGLRENFISRVFCYHRWQQLACGRVTRNDVVEFHTAHKYLLLAHSRRHYQALGHLVADAGRYRPTDLARQYGELFMQALHVKATIRKHVNVLQHLVGHFKHLLRLEERAELDSVVKDYHLSLVPLIVPITLIKHYVLMHHIDYIQNQVYLNPHPKELMLRNQI